ncbi:hypothetical protein ACFQH6_09580 [Halobacteriaceae archaeon GCM10025711]
MALTNPSTVVSFDADGAREAALDAVEGTLYSVVEYDARAFNPLYVSDATLETYGDREQMLAHFEEIHSYVHVDFMEHRLFTDNLFPVADHVEYITTAMDFMQLVRVYVGNEGLFLALDPDESVQPVVAAIRGAIGDDSP